MINNERVLNQIIKEVFRELREDLMEDEVTEMEENVDKAREELDFDFSNNKLVTRDNFIAKAEMMKTLLEFIKNPMVHELNVLSSTSDLSRAIKGAVSSDIDFFVHTLSNVCKLPNEEVNTFLTYLAYDVDDKRDLITNAFEYERLWNMISNS